MTVIHPRTAAEARTYAGEFRAGGTDLEARRKIGLTDPVTIDLRAVPGLRGIRRGDEGTRIGAMERLVTVATDLADYPALALTAASVANPHTRAVATVGGNLLQRTRCWYYRTGEVDCFKTGATGCPARPGVHDFGNVFDTSSCVAPHPSSLAMALVVYDAAVEVDPVGRRSVASLFDPIDPRMEHTLAPGEVLTAVLLPPPVSGERAAYHRVTSRAMAEWPVVEGVCRFALDDRGAMRGVAIGLGAVAPVPIRATEAEAMLEGRVPDSATFDRAGEAATNGARPAPQAAHKVRLIAAVVREVLEQAMDGSAQGELAVHERGLAANPRSEPDGNR